MIFKDRIIDIINVLEEGGLVCMPDEHRWNMAFLPMYHEKYDQHPDLKKYLGKNFTILYESLDHLKYAIPTLHPRVETMLVYYKRTFLMETDAGRLINMPPLGKNCYVTIARNDYLKTIISLLGQPLILWPFKKPIISDQDIPEEVKKMADYICLETDYINTLEAYVTFSVDEEGMLLEV